MEDKVSTDAKLTQPSAQNQPWNPETRMSNVEQGLPAFGGASQPEADKRRPGNFEG